MNRSRFVSSSQDPEDQFSSGSHRVSKDRIIHGPMWERLKLRRWFEVSVGQVSVVNLNAGKNQPSRHIVAWTGRAFGVISIMVPPETCFQSLRPDFRGWFHLRTKNLETWVLAGAPGTSRAPDSARITLCFLATGLTSH